jgi:Fur family ferric uptake transcriptional regulator
LKTEPQKVFRQFLESKGLKFTQQRRDILEYLLRTKKHVTPEEIFADGRHGYEHKFARPHHDHMICVECSQVIEFSNPTIEKLQDDIAKHYEFAPLWHRHEIFGKCRKCR